MIFSRSEYKSTRLPQSETSQMDTRRHLVDVFTHLVETETQDLFLELTEARKKSEDLMKKRAEVCAYTKQITAKNDDLDKRHDAVKATLAEMQQVLPGMRVRDKDCTVFANAVSNLAKTHRDKAI